MRIRLTGETPVSLKIIGTGLGRTGTYSLKIALNQIGAGPCHHMEEVLNNMDRQVPLWNAAVEGRPDWQSIYEGYRSAVDWPTCSFYRDLLKEYPDARFILTHRDPGKWADSFGFTIQKFVARRNDMPPPVRDWLEMANGAIEKAGVTTALDRDGLINAFNAHNERVRATIPAGQLLEFEVKEGWEPLCSFLGVPVPDDEFPRTNNREEFWDLVQAAG